MLPNGHAVVGIAGHGGYAGQVFHALAMQHPRITARPFSGRDPTSETSLATARACDVVVLCLPGETVRESIAELREHAPRILDLSDAHRLEPRTHYGIPELFGAPPREAKLVANPGCYPTATLLALRPLLDAAVIERDGIAVVGASGASGAGKALADRLHFCNLAENMFPYKVGEHRHLPEIEAHLGAEISFVTELLPIVRGMLITAFVRPCAGVSPADVTTALRSRYESCPFITVLDAPDDGLGLRHVVGTHQALLAVGPVARSGLLPVFSAIDNLGRGAATQAMHNLCLWLDLDPMPGLPAPLGSAPAGTPAMFGAVRSILSSARD